jgi:quercetin dioxygenase-like cupin family protein
MFRRRQFLLLLAALAVPARLWAKVGRALRRADLERIEAGPGEVIHLLRGDRHGFDRLSLLFAESAPGGGPPLHTHDCEEVHVVESGRVSYVVGDDRFILDGPFIQHIGAGIPHAFVNAGAAPIRITAIFSSREYTFTFKGPNPLQPPLAP